MKLKGSTILEVVVAMVVLMLVFTISMTVWFNVIGSRAIPQRMQAALLGAHEMELVYNNELLVSGRSEREGMLIEKIVTDRETPGLKEVTIIVKNKQGKQLWKGKQLVLPN